MWEVCREMVNKYTERAETYWKTEYEDQPIPRIECELKTCLQKYGGGDNKKKCEFAGHVFCCCPHCTKHPCCLRCRLFMENGHYL